jgi:hypothetical protein
MNAPHPLQGFEVKTSRSDWRRELADPEKADAVARYCRQWWLVIPSADMVKPGELPADWGLMVCSGLGLRAYRSAPLRMAVDPPRGFWAAFTRAAVKTERGRRDRAESEPLPRLPHSGAHHPLGGGQCVCGQPVHTREASNGF